MHCEVNEGGFKRAIDCPSKGLTAYEALSNEIASFPPKGERSAIIGP